MKIIFLNTWHGKKDGFTDYITSQVKTTDIFCFQEAYGEMRKKCKPILSHFQLFTRSKKLTGENHYSLATYVRNSIKISNWLPLLTDKIGVGLGIYVQIEKAGQQINLINLHGTPYPGNKLDSPMRLQQSNEILAFLDQLNSPIIIGGDFNLDPGARSIRIFEERGLRNLIKEHNISSTRNELAWKRFSGTPLFYSDYVFISSDISAKVFKVPRVLVSDHQPLVLEIN